ncbi:MAG: M3 family metallopeptidase [Pseudomonadota bacterium]
MSNTFLAGGELPPFDRLKAEDVVSGLTELLTQNRATVAELVTQSNLSFASLIEPLEELGHTLQRHWSPVSHLQMVSSERRWRDAHAEAIGLLADYATEMAQHEGLQQAVQRLRDSMADGDSAEARLLDLRLREFRKAGVALPADQKARFRDIMAELAQLSTTFSQNVQDATDAWHYFTADETKLEGLPQSLIDQAHDRALQHDQNGYRLQLDMPTYQQVSTHAENEQLRKSFYEAWVTRASDQGPTGVAFDNRGLIQTILGLRHEAATLVGYENFAEFALDGRMAESSNDVLQFLNDLAERSLTPARAELNRLEEYAGRRLAPWDVNFYAEKVKQRRFDISQQELRKYFPIDAVLDGMFALVGELYGLTINRRTGVAVWDPEVVFYDVAESSGEKLGSFYADLYARPGKRSGAWIDECVIRKSLGEEHALPVGYLVCNFSAPSASQPSTLTHDEVVTLFHEFGHMLHHVLTRIPYPSIAGINGVPWDAVELPSQFMENFAWDARVLGMISRHTDSDESIDAATIERLLASRQFNAGLAMLRQLEFALFDFRLHQEFDPARSDQLETILGEVRGKVGLIEPPSWNRFANSFGHIFAGGYAAGYYSYKWAEVLAADAYLALETDAGIDPSMAQRFRESILEIGGSRDIMAAFVEFRGREPQPEALLSISGIG